MNQPPTRRCARCGSSATADQRFCPNCGAVIDEGGVNPTAQARDQNFSSYPGGTPPPPPPPQLDQYGTLPQQSRFNEPISPYEQRTESQYPSYTPNPSMGQGAQIPVAPDFVRPIKNDSKSVWRQIGCVTGLLILLGVAICGALGYGVFALVSHSTSSISHVNAGNTTVNSNGNATSVAVPVKTVPLNLKVKYSTIDLTIIDVKQGTSFEGDQNSGNPDIIRVDLNEVNSTSHSVNAGYTDFARLILPDQSSIPPANYEKLEPPASGASQQNWLDFPVPVSTSIDKLILRLGTAQEAQMDIPLTAGADLTKYQDVKVQPNASTTYAGLKWTITSATLSWSADSSQAAIGKRFVTVSVSVDNPTATSEQAYWGDYMRLKGGSLTSSPESDATIPLDFPASSTGVTGSVSFAVPQDSSAYTLILLPNQLATGSLQATIDFHIP